MSDAPDITLLVGDTRIVTAHPLNQVGMPFTGALTNNLTATADSPSVLTVLDSTDDSLSVTLSANGVGETIVSLTLGGLCAHTLAVSVQSERIADFTMSY